MLREKGRKATAGPSTALRSPGFPVELGGVGALHAAFLNESSTRGFVQRSVAGNPGPVGMTIHLQGSSVCRRGYGLMASQNCHPDLLFFFRGFYTPSSGRYHLMSTHGELAIY